MYIAIFLVVGISFMNKSVKSVKSDSPGDMSAKVQPKDNKYPYPTEVL